MQRFIFAFITTVFFLSHSLISIEAKEPVENFDDWDVGKHGQYLGYLRDYYDPLTSEDNANIRHIVLSLANKSLISLLANKKHLEDVGDRVDHVHPLKFCLPIFTDEEMKVAIRNVRARGWVWDSFIGGMADSFETERALDNMKVEFLVDFANEVGVDVNLLYPAVQQRKWEAFVDLLIKHVPRRGDYDHYDS